MVERELLHVVENDRFSHTRMQSGSTTVVVAECLLF